MIYLRVTNIPVLDHQLRHDKIVEKIYLLISREIRKTYYLPYFKIYRECERSYLGKLKNNAVLS